MRYFVRFIELEEAFDKHGFEKKVRTDTLILSQVNERLNTLLTINCRVVRSYIQNHKITNKKPACKCSDLIHLSWDRSSNAGFSYQ